MHVAVYSIDRELYITKEWKDAVEEDGKYISDYARESPLD